MLEILKIVALAIIIIIFGSITSQTLKRKKKYPIHIKMSGFMHNEIQITKIQITETP